MSRNCHKPASSACARGRAGRPSANPQIAWFADMVSKNLRYVEREKKRGRKLVGISCEYTPRELILAAGAMPACLCGGSAAMIPPAEAFLPSNLCPLIKSTFGYSVEQANPFLEMADLVVAETTCDGKKKMYELLGRRHPMVVMELPQKPDDPDAFERWVSELQRLRGELERRLGAAIPDAALRRAATRMNEERRLRRGLAGLMRLSEPPLTGRELLDFKAIVSCIPGDLAQYAKALRSLKGRRLSPPARDRVRVLLTGVPMPHGAERVVELVESSGGLIVAQENCTGLKPILEDVDADAPDILRAIAAKYFHLPCSVMTPNRARMDVLRQLAAGYRADCIVDVVWQACLTYDVESFLVRELAGQLELPYLRIETDYSPSDSARLAVRIQALFESVRAR